MVTFFQQSTWHDICDFSLASLWYFSSSLSTYNYTTISSCLITFVPREGFFLVGLRGIKTCGDLNLWRMFVSLFICRSCYTLKASIHLLSFANLTHIMLYCSTLRFHYRILNIWCMYRVYWLLIQGKRYFSSRRSLDHERKRIFLFDVGKEIYLYSRCILEQKIVGLGVGQRGKVLGL